MRRWKRQRWERRRLHWLQWRMTLVKETGISDLDRMRMGG